MRLEFFGKLLTLNFKVRIDENGKFDLVKFLKGLYIPSEFSNGVRWPKATKDAVFRIFQAVERSEEAPRSVADWDVLARAWCHTAGCRPKENMTPEQKQEAELAW